MKQKKFRLNKGIQARFIEQNKFNTFSFAIIIKNKLDKQRYSLLPFLGFLLVSACQKYPSISAFKRQKEALYNLQIYHQELSLGRNRHLALVMDGIEPRLISDNKNYLVDVVDFLAELLFRPLANNQQFDEAYFRMQKERYLSHLKSIQDYKGMYTRHHINDFVSKKHPLRYDSYTAGSQVEEASSSMLYQLYADLMKNEMLV